MRVAIFSDVHGNLSALEAVLESIDSEAGVEQVIFAGDFGVFGPRPAECLDLLRRQPTQAIVGNTDEWVLNPPPLVEGLDEQERDRRRYLQDICNWTKEQLDNESIRWIEQVRNSFSITLSPSEKPVDKVLIVHANPVDLAQIIFPSESRQLELYGRVRQRDKALSPILNGVGASTIVFGHLHIPGIREWRGKQLINISSVSLPGDGDPRAKYGILNWNEANGWQFEQVNVPYEIEEEIEAFSSAQPPGWQRAVNLLTEKGFIPQIV